MAAANILNDLLQEVALLSRALRFSPSAEAVDGLGFPGGGREILRMLADTRLSVPQIARRKGTSRQNIQVIVNRLVAGGWLSFSPNPDHRRSPLVEVTARGAESMRAVISTREALLKQLHSAIDEKEAERAGDVLRRIRALLAERNGQRPTATTRRKRQGPGTEFKSKSADAPETPPESEIPVSLL